MLLIPRPLSLGSLLSPALTVCATTCRQSAFPLAGSIDRENRRSVREFSPAERNQREQIVYKESVVQQENQNTTNSQPSATN